jgi:hypothetical protein
MSSFSLCLSWTVLISPLNLKDIFAACIILIDSYILSELEIDHSMLSWLLEFLLGELR